MEGFFVEYFPWFIIPILRVPGVFLEAVLKKGGSFEVAWEKGDRFRQALVGLVCYVGLVLLAIAAS